MDTWRSSLAALSVLIGVAASAPAAVAAPSHAGAVSQYRLANGLTAVKPDAALTRMAANQAAAMARAGQMSHSVGGEFYGRLRQSGFRFVRAGENLGEGYANFAEAMAGWKGSDGHRANLLMDGATRVGVASARGRNGQIYWAMVLAAPMPQGPPLRYYAQPERAQPVAEPAPKTPKGAAKRAAESASKGASKAGSGDGGQWSFSASPLLAIKRLFGGQ